jgi:hypothetical protein
MTQDIVDITVTELTTVVNLNAPTVSEVTVNVTSAPVIQTSSTTIPQIVVAAAQRGPTGPTGPQGETGPKGDKGDPGILSLATTSVAGGVIPGSGINFDPTSATISVPYGAGINTVQDIPNVNSTGLTDGSLLVYNLTTNRWDVTTNLTQENWDSGQY